MPRLYHCTLILKRFVFELSRYHILPVTEVIHLHPRNVSFFYSQKQCEPNYLFIISAINSGCSYAIVDSEYEFRTPESAEASGCLDWERLDPDDPDFETKGRRLMLEGMDFPVVVSNFIRPSTSQPGLEGSLGLVSSFRET